MADTLIPPTTEASDFPGWQHGNQKDVTRVEFQKPEHSLQTGHPSPVSRAPSLSLCLCRSHPHLSFSPCPLLFVLLCPDLFYFILFCATLSTYDQCESLNWRSDKSKCYISNWARTCQVRSIYTLNILASKLLWGTQNKTRTRFNECSPPL